MTALPRLARRANYLLLIFFSENHSYNTRNASLSVRKIRKNNEFGAKSIKIKGSDLWNNLKNSIKVVLNTKQFRYDYKKSILPYNSNV